MQPEWYDFYMVVDGKATYLGEGYFDGRNLAAFFKWPDTPKNWNQAEVTFKVGEYVRRASGDNRIDDSARLPWFDYWIHWTMKGTQLEMFHSQEESGGR